MPTKNPRYQVVFRKTDVRVLKTMATRSKQTISTLIDEIIADHLDKDDDAYWLRVAMENELSSENQHIDGEMVLRQAGL